MSDIKDRKDRNAVVDYNPTEAQRLIAEAREDRHGWNAIAKIKALADQLEAAGREVESQWRRNDEIRASLASTTAERDTLRAELASVREVADPDHDTPELSLRERVMHIGEQAALLVSVTRMAKERGEERDSLRQQLEAAQRERDEAMRVSVVLGKHADAIADMRVAHEMDGLKYDLGAAQRRIASLERACDAHASTADEANDRVSGARQRIAELEAKVEGHLCNNKITMFASHKQDAEIYGLTNALRAILPVYRAAESPFGNLKHGPKGRGGSGPCDAGCIKCSVDVARAAITPEIAAVLAGLEKS